jgi:hypothetical protein
MRAVHVVGFRLVIPCLVPAIWMMSPPGLAIRPTCGDPTKRRRPVAICAQPSGARRDRGRCEGRLRISGGGGAIVTLETAVSTGQTAHQFAGPNRGRYSQFEAYTYLPTLSSQFRPRNTLGRGLSLPSLFDAQSSL